MKHLTFLTLLTAIAMTACNDADPLVVETSNGRVKGYYPETNAWNHEGTSGNRVMGFLGIPYAKTERFMPPMPADPWDTIRICDHWGPMTMQPSREPRTEEEMSEQCCVMNIWTNDLTSKKPVMLWLHGGGFDSGTAEWDPGMCLAQEDVVVVSVNHRLNILGFLDLSKASDKYKHSGNVGMLDVVQALRWIKENIANFGGDAQNVTVFGESGGGGKVGTLLCMPDAQDLFHKAIILSGTILNVNTKQMTEELGMAVLDELGITADSIEKINDVPYDTLYAAGQRAMAASIGTRKPGTPMMWGFGPTPDGETLLQQPFQPGFASIADNKPIIIGTVFNELMRLTYNDSITMEEARAQLEPVFGALTQDFIDAFGEAYPDYTPQDLLSADRLFRPKTILTADAIAQREASTYVYMFLRKHPVSHGAVHGHELKFCFNSLDFKPYELASPDETDRRVAKEMSIRWSNFAKTGNPNSPLLEIEWPTYSAENGQTLMIGDSTVLRQNHDRRLEEIIDRCCFKQLDAFRAAQSANQ